MKTLKVIAVVLLVVIVLGAGIYWMVSGMSNRGLEGFQTATTPSTAMQVVNYLIDLSSPPYTQTEVDNAPNPLYINNNYPIYNNSEPNRKLKIGDKINYYITSSPISASNDVKGINTYTLGSDIKTVALHSGIVTGTKDKSGTFTIPTLSTNNNPIQLTLLIVPAPTNFVAFANNNITSGSKVAVQNELAYIISQKNAIGYLYPGTTLELQYKHNNTIVNGDACVALCNVKWTGKDKSNITDKPSLLDSLLTPEGYGITYITIKKSELYFMQDTGNAGKFNTTILYYASCKPQIVNDQTFILPSVIICRLSEELPDNIVLYNENLFDKVSINSKDKPPIIWTNDGATSDPTNNMYISDQDMALVKREKAINYNIGKYYKGSTNEISKISTPTLDSKNKTLNLNTDHNTINSIFGPDKNTVYYYFNDRSLNVGKKLTETQLSQKTSNLATAQAELSAASAALNNAIRSIPSVEAFQTVGTATTTTTAQVVSPIIAKINQLKELLAQKAAEFANAKAAAEAQAKKASNNAAKAIDNAKAAANAQVKAAEETIAKLQSEIASAETKLGLLSQQLKMAVSQFQDVAALTTDKSLSDDLVSIETQIEDLTKAKKSAEGKLDDLRKLLQDAQFTTDPALLGSELANARSVLNNPPAQGACPQQKACPNISALDDTIRNLTNENASLGQKNDTKEAVIKDLDGKLDIANTTIDQLKDKIANFDKALTNEERELITNQKNDAVFAKQEIESKLKLTEYERDKAMKSRDEYRTKYETCADDLRNTFAGTATPVNAGTMMGGMPPSYVCKAMPANSGVAAPDRYAMQVPPDRYPPFNPEPEMPAPEVADRLTTGGGNFVGMVGTGVSGTQQGTEQQKQQAAASTAGIADTNLTAQTGFTDIPKQAINQQIQNTKSNHYWTYRPENYDSHDRYSAPSTWWVTGYNS